MLWSARMLIVYTETEPMFVNYTNIYIILLLLTSLFTKFRTDKQTYRLTDKIGLENFHTMI